MEKAAEIGPPGLICIHPENYEIVRIFEERLKKAGRTDMAAWDERSPHFCEAGHVRNYAYYAGVTGCPLYIVHTTTRESIQEILKAKAEGVKIYAQTGHHYLTLSHDVWKLNVPLRDEETMAYLWEALRAGQPGLYWHGPCGLGNVARTDGQRATSGKPAAVSLPAWKPICRSC